MPPPGGPIRTAAQHAGTKSTCGRRHSARCVMVKSKWEGNMQHRTLGGAVASSRQWRHSAWSACRSSPRPRTPPPDRPAGRSPGAGTHGEGDDPQPVPRRRHHAADRRRQRPEGRPELPEDSQCYQLKVLDRARQRHRRDPRHRRPTDFPVRAELLADEIAGEQPDLVGLQEVALWRHGPLELDQVGGQRDDVDYDFLQILLDELAARGPTTSPVSVADRADVEAPSFTGSPFDGTSAATPATSG